MPEVQQPPLGAVVSRMISWYHKHLVSSSKLTLQETSILYSMKPMERCIKGSSLDKNTDSTKAIFAALPNSNTQNDCFEYDLKCTLYL